MIVKNKGSWCEKHNQYARTKFDCPYCELDELRERVARLEETLKRGVELHENCDADTCMCGEPMHHPLSGHMPVAMLQYYGDQWAEEARRALEEK